MLKLSNKTNNKIVFFDSQLEAKKWAMNNIKWIRHTKSRAVRGRWWGREKKMLSVVDRGVFLVVDGKAAVNKEQNIET